MVMICGHIRKKTGQLSVLALSSRFDGPIIMAFIVLALLSFSTRSVESF